MHIFPGLNPFHFFFLFPFFAVFFLAFAAIGVIPYFFIFRKAGFSPWLALLIFVPLVNLIVLYVVAFSQWNVVPISQVYPAPPPVMYPPQA